MLGADTPPVEAAAALTGFLPFGSRLRKREESLLSIFSSISLLVRLFYTTPPSLKPAARDGSQQQEFQEGGRPMEPRDCPSGMAGGQWPSSRLLQDLM